MASVDANIPNENQSNPQLPQGHEHCHTAKKKLKPSLAALPKQLEPQLPHEYEGRLESEKEVKIFLDEKELLARIPICRRTCYTWIQQGKLPCVRVNRRKIFHWPSVEAALLRLQRGGNR